VVERVQRDVLELLKVQLKPEFLNRIDEIVMFEPLSRLDIEKIVDLQMGALRKMLEHNGLVLNYTDAAREYIATVGYDAMYGARPVKRVIQREVVGELSKRILAGVVSREKPIVIDAVDGTLKVTN
jgi:ATP-dependent Clp protease ATP-binding subunit ClpB